MTKEEKEKLLEKLRNCRIPHSVNVDGVILNKVLEVIKEIIEEIYKEQNK